MTESSAIIQACRHCGDVCTGNNVNEEGIAFCCEGCAAVYKILHGGVPISADSYAELDNDVLAKQFMEHKSDNAVRYRLYLPDMYCANCVWTLEQMQVLDEGILHSEVDFIRKLIRVTINPQKTSLRKVAQLLSSIGYPPHLSDEENTEQATNANRLTTRKLYARIAVAAFATGNVMMMSIARYLAGAGGLDSSLQTVFIVLSVAISVPVLLFSASPWLTAAFVSIKHRKVSLDVPVALGITVLFGRSLFDIYSGTGEGFLDSFVGLVLFLLIGRLFQLKAFNSISFARTYKSFFPLSIRVRRNSTTTVVPIGEIVIGDRMEIRNGETIPCDGVTTSSNGYIDYSFVTGESSPVEVINGSIVQAGGKVIGKGLRVVAVKKSSQSYLASLWENHQSNSKQNSTTDNSLAQSSYLKLSDSFGLYFSILTLSTAIIGFVFWLPNVAMAFNVFTAVLIIACPCALTIAAPVTLGTAMSSLSKFGVYVKNISVFVEIQKISNVLFDKTGTLTHAGVDVKYSGRALSAFEQSTIASVAAQSVHPVSRSIAATAAHISVVDVNENIGQGISGSVNGTVIKIGRLGYVTESPLPNEIGTHVSINGEVVGKYEVESKLRSGVDALVKNLRAKYQVSMISGDSTAEAPLFGGCFSDTEMHFNNAPDEKREFVKQLQRSGASVLMVGDGLNDGLAMMASNVGIAVTDSAGTIVPACSIVMPANKLQFLSEILTYSNTLHKIIAALFAFTVLYNLVVVSLALMGLITPILAAILMPLNSLLVIGVSVFGARIAARSITWA
ncbi:MAG: HAD-IC family P-type ATPase [Ignavibacteria bacterium]|nr:HAD-IC family P-type ATPase [Ignavibacteria bacterium]